MTMVALQSLEPHSAAAATRGIVAAAVGCRWIAAAAAAARANSCEDEYTADAVLVLVAQRQAAAGGAEGRQKLVVRNRHAACRLCSCRAAQQMLRGYKTPLPRDQCLAMVCFPCAPYPGLLPTHK